MINLFNNNIKDKHDFIFLNIDNGKWVNRKLTCIPINSGMGITGQQYYLEAKAKAYKAEQATRKTINDLRHFSSALLERSSEVFKPITTNQDKNQQLLAKALEQEKKAIENKPEKENHSVKTGLLDQQEEGFHYEDKETLSKIECIDLIESDKNMKELFGITMYKDEIIRFHIYEDFYNHKLIEKGIDHKIEFIEEIDRTLIKASRTKTKL